MSFVPLPVAPDPADFPSGPHCQPSKQKTWVFGRRNKTIMRPGLFLMKFLGAGEGEIFKRGWGRVLSKQGLQHGGGNNFSKGAFQWGGRFLSPVLGVGGGFTGPRQMVGEFRKKCKWRVQDANKKMAGPKRGLTRFLSRFPKSPMGRGQAKTAQKQNGPSSGFFFLTLRGFSLPRGR